MADGGQLENRKIGYLQYRLANFDKIKYRNAYQPSQPDEWPYVWKFENPATILKIN